MSAIIPNCERCNLDRVFVRLAAFGNEQSYGVEWKCPKCDHHLLDICPLGPLAPTAQTCLNCGASYADQADFAACPACGTTRLGALDLFGLDPAPTDPIARAEKFFNMGLARRALGTLNHALVANPSLEPAWRIKYSFVSGLGFTHAALAVVEAATEFVVNPDLLISYAHLLAAQGRAKDARGVYHEYVVTAPRGEYAELAHNAIRRIDAGG